MVMDSLCPICVCVCVCRSGYELSLLEPTAAALSSESDSEFEPGTGGKRKRKRGTTASDFVRMTSRKRGVVSYKESSHSDLSGDNGEGGEEGGRGEAPLAEEDSRDGIERVLKCRQRSKSCDLSVENCLGHKCCFQWRKWVRLQGWST